VEEKANRSKGFAALPYIAVSLFRTRHHEPLFHETLDVFLVHVERCDADTFDLD